MINFKLRTKARINLGFKLDVKIDAPLIKH